MKILLTAINAKYIHSNLAVYSLKAYAKEYTEYIELAEYTINHRVEYILQELYKKKPDVLCFSCYIWNFRYVQELIEEIHKLLPELSIWVGGPEVSYEPEGFLRQFPMVKGIMIGEGEETFRELCKYYVNQEHSAKNPECFTKNPECFMKNPERFTRNPEVSTKNQECSKKNPQELQNIHGLLFRNEENELVQTPRREPVSMDKLPFCYDHLEDFENRIIYYETSRGCPFSCSYCLSSIEKGLRFRSLELVKKELQFFLDHKVPQVKFVDRTFNCNHNHTMEIWKYIKEHDNGITNFHFEISADLLTEEEIALIADMRPGLIQLEIGVQSTFAPTIQEIHRTMNLSRLEEIVKKVQRAGNIHQHLDLIAGLPKEDFDTFAKSFQEIYQLKPEQLQLGFLKVLKGSYMYEHQQEYGLVYQSNPPYEVMSTNWLTYEEVLKIKLVEEMLEVYYNSGQFEMTMKVLELAYENPFDMFLELGEYYEKHGLFAMNHSRIRRCEILLDFVREKDAGHEAIYKETLTFDLYYRENMKTRPAWAPAMADFKEETREYCKNGKLSHVEPFFYDMELLLNQKSILEYPAKGTRSFYLFSYEKKNPLTGQAEVIKIKKKEEVSHDKKNRRNIETFR